MPRRHQGFTLVEMLIVIVIIGLLAIALIPKILASMERARDTARISDVRQISQGLQSYIYNTNTIPTSAGTGYKDISSISGELLEYLKSIPEDKGRGLKVNSDGDCIVSGNNYAYYAENNKAIVTAAMEGGKGNSPTCLGVTGPKNVFGKHSDGYNLEIGSYSKTMSFDGVDDYVDLGSGIIDFGTNNWTTSLWIKNEVHQDVGGILTKQHNVGVGYNGFYFGTISNPNCPYFYVAIPSRSRELNSFLGEVYPRTNVIIQRSGDQLNLYTNGIFRTQTNGLAEYFSDNLNAILHIGKGLITSNRYGITSNRYGYYSGSISNVRIYNRTLSTSEITQLYQKSDIMDGLVAHYKLDETEGTTIYDSSGNGYHGVLKNMSEEDMQKDSDYVLVN